MSNQLVPQFSVIPNSGSAEFQGDTDAFLGELPAFVDGMNALKDYLDARSEDASAVALWVSGSDYAKGDPRVSPADKKTYRAKAAITNSTTDPSTDPANWGVAGGVSAADQAKLDLLSVSEAVNTDLLAPKRLRTADGSGSARDLVVRQPDGTAKAVVSTETSNTVGTAATAVGSTIQVMTSCAIGAGRHLFLYEPSAQTSCMAVVGEFDGASWVFGTPVQVYGSNVNIIQCDYDASVDRAVVSLQDNSSKFIYAKALRFTGTAITPGAQATIVGENTGTVKMACGGGVALWCYYTTAGAKEAVAASITDITLGVGAAITLTALSGGVYVGSVAWMDADAKFAVLFADQYWKQYVNALSVSGTTVSKGTELQIFATSNVLGQGVICDAGNSTLFVASPRYTSGNGKFAAVALSGASFVSVGAFTDFPVNLSPRSATYDPVNQVVALLASEPDNSNYLGLRTYSLAGTTVTPEEALILVSEAVTVGAVHLDTTNSALVFSYNDYLGTDFLYVNDFTFASVETNVASWIGYALEDFTDGAAFEVSTPGDIIGGFSGLIYDEEYYPEPDGSPTITPNAYGKIGRAISATELLQTGPEL